MKMGGHEIAYGLGHWGFRAKQRNFRLIAAKEQFVNCSGIETQHCAQRFEYRERKHEQVRAYIRNERIAKNLPGHWRDHTLAHHSVVLKRTSKGGGVHETTVNSRLMQESVIGKETDVCGKTCCANEIETLL